MAFLFGPPSYSLIIINDLFLKDPSFFYISFSNNEFDHKKGYYKIIDGKLDLIILKF